MKKENSKKKKRISRLIVAALVAGITMPAFVNYLSVVEAAAPSPDYFLSADAASGNIPLVQDCMANDVRINFGGQEWYVAGSAVNKQHAILYSGASRGKTKYQEKSPSADNKINFEEGGGSYGVDDTGASKSPASVEASHYGASTLRENLLNLQRNGFVNEERNLMVPIELPLNDSNGLEYTVSDRLYAPMFKDGKLSFGGQEIFLKGDLASKEIWTQTNDLTATNLGQAYSYSSGSGQLSNVSDVKDILPVFELDLSHVLFGSVVPLLASGSKVLDDADKGTVNLRVDGKDTIFADTAVAYNTAYVRCDNVPSGSRLIIQGSTDDGTNWYYAEDVVNSKTISAGNVMSSINSMLKTANKTEMTQLDFKSGGCEIWVENQSTGSSFAYALKATEGIIDTIELENIKSPVPNQPLDTSVTCKTFGVCGVGENGNLLETPPAYIAWYSNGTVVTGNAEFEKNYTAQIKLGAFPGYQLSPTVKVKIKTTDDPVREFEKEAKPENGVVTVDFSEFTTLPDKEIKYDITETEYKGEYDGLRHGIELRNVSSGATVEYSLRVEGQDPAEKVWSRELSRFTYKDVGEYDIDFRITKKDCDEINTYTDDTYYDEPLKPAHISITPRTIKIIPGDQRIRWGNILNPDKYELSRDSSLATGDMITKLTLNPSTTDITETGLIYAFSGKDEEGNNYIEIRDNNGKGDDVTDNYLIVTDIPGNLVIEHNPDLGPESLTIEKEKTEYIIEKEELSVNDIKVIAKYPDGFSEPVLISDCTTNMDDIDMTTLGGKSLAVSYTKGEGEFERTATASLTIYVVEEPDPEDPESNKGEKGDPGEKGEKGDPGTPGTPGTSGTNGTNGTSGTNGTNGNNTNSGVTTMGNNGSGTTTGTTTGNNTGTSTGTSTTRSTTNGATTTTNRTRVASARTGDTNPIAIWVLTALASGIAVVSLMIFNLNRGAKKRKHKK